VLLNVWCPQQHVLALPAFDPTVLSSWQVMQYERLLLLPEQQFLQLMSTSPEHEPAWFVEGAGILASAKPSNHCFVLRFGMCCQGW
jgi:hypothetical protein